MPKKQSPSLEATPSPAAPKRPRASARRAELGLTPRQKLFCLAYLANGCNGAQAALEAGYSQRCAKQQATENLTKASVKAYLEPLLAKRVAKLELKAEKLDEELARCAHLDPAALFDEQGRLVRDLSKLPADVRRAVRSVKVKEIFEGRGEEREHVGDLVEVKFEPKVEAIGLAYRRLGLLKEKVEHEHTFKLEDLVGDPGVEEAE